MNNHPYEEIKMMKGNWWSSDSSKQCYDQWQAEERDEMRPVCGYQYTTKKVVQPDGSYKEVKNRIWDSQASSFLITFLFCGSLIRKCLMK